MPPLFFRKAFFLLFIGLSLRAADLPAKVSPAVQKAADQFRDFNLGRGGFTPAPNLKQALAAAKSLQADGSWNDLDYDSSARSGWPPAIHYTRMVLMASAAVGRINISATDRQQLLEAVHRAFRFWIANDFQCPNWWYNEIGTPKGIGTCALLLGDKLATDEYAYTTRTLLPRYDIGRTGQNKVWLAGNTLMLGLLTGDEASIDKASTAIWSELSISTDDEGIQSDYSFHQHGAQLQFGNYGMAFATELCDWGAILRGTPWAMSENKLAIFRHYLLDGQNWISWRGAMDISSCGRQLMPHSPVEKTTQIDQVMKEAAIFDPGAASDYLAFVARNRPDAANDLVGNRYFWRSDYMVQRTRDFAVTLKMSSSRVIGTEMVNSENLSGYHLAEGALYLYRRGDEYADIFPVWDWRKIPGVTCAQTDLPAFKTSSVNSEFVGGVSDGLHGCAALDFSRGGITAKKAWFFCDRSVVCLGAGINGDSEAPVITTINQCLLHGSIRLQHKESGKSPGTAGADTTLPDVDWIEHDGWRYAFPGRSTVHLAAGPVTGNWSQVFRNPQTPRQDITQNVFTLWLDHGNVPKDASYEYVVVPAGEKAAATVIVNSPAVQAVQMAETLFGVVFWSAGKIELTGALTLEVDHPCLVLVDSEKRRAWVSDPTQDLSQVRLTVGKSTQTIALPAGTAAGETVSVVIGH
ncbi:MAG: polysaccharide lyase family 8 super-sandwich domain-containing protein [Opitutaceae bacterium]|jgi:chondroitin AC lyase